MTSGGPGSSLAGETSPPPQPSRRLSLMPRRLDVWATPGRAGTAAARVLYQPRNRARVAAGVVARMLPATSHRTFPAPDTQLIVEQVAEITGVKATAAAALHVRGTDR